MADTLVGFGLGLTGTPKDYTSIVAARERQKGIEEAKKREEEQKQYQDYMKATVVKDHMNYKTGEIPIELAKNLEEFKKAKDMGDYRGMMLAQQRMVDYAETSKNEYNEWVNLKKNIQAGKQIIDADIDAIDKATSAQDVTNLNPAAAQYDPNARRVNWMAVDKVDFPKHYMDIVDKTPKIGGTKKTKFTGPGGYVTELGALDTDPTQYQARLNVAWGLDPTLQQNAIIQYKNSKGWLGKTADQISAITGQTITDQDISNEAKNLYIKDGLSFLETNYRTLKNAPVPRQTSFYATINTQPEGKNLGDFQDQTVDLLFKDAAGRETAGQYQTKALSLQGWGVSMPNTGSYRDLNSGDKIPFTKYDNIDFSYVGVFPTLKRSFTKEGGKKWEAGEIPPPYLLNELLKDPNLKNDIVYKAIAVGQGEYTPYGSNVKRQSKVYRDFSEVQSALADKLSPKQQIEWNNNRMPKLEQIVKEYNSTLPGGGAPPTKSGGKSKWDPFEEK